ncbi:MAG: SUMF1/EgtB/PvdO family nonheme iron enzyme [Sandaracinaceae bacterium]|nr:SUMF1/EgtB/PvdO family nonheme iron enzyme [Sandaracinaceae bacterium]
MIELGPVDVPRTFDPPRVDQILEARGTAFVFVSGERSEVLRLDRGRLESTQSPFMVASPPCSRRMARLGDGTLAVPDRDQIHLYDGAEWRTVATSSRMVAVSGTGVDDLLGLTAAKRALWELAGAWRPASLDGSNHGFSSVDAGPDRCVAIRRGRVLERREGRWREAGIERPAMLEAHVFGDDHAVVHRDGHLFVHRGLAWDPVRLEVPEGGTVDFIRSWRGHTFVGGVDAALRGWAQIGRRARYRFELRGPATSAARWLDWSSEGRVALLGDTTLWLGEPLESPAAGADERLALGSTDPRARTVRVAASVGVSSTEGDALAVEAFEIDRAPVTNRDWAQVASALSLRAPEHWPGGRIPPDREDHPVVGVPWDDAQRYAASRGMRLPTEHEWERAARGTDGRRFVAGDSPPELPPTSKIRTRAVTSPSPASPFGLEHVGMVWEWTDTPEGAGHIVRGGPWRDRAAPAEIANRSVENDRALDVGFRCARSVDAAAPRDRDNPYR